MLDLYSRQITYLRISVTERCNLRCIYCMPEEGVKLSTEKPILSFEEIVMIVTAATGMGIDKIRLTGGEPLVRRGIVDLVSTLSQIQGVKELVMTTNGTLLEPVALPLKSAGLDRINISLDTLDPEEYSRLTRGGNINDALKGIEAARSSGLPVKINMVCPPDASQIELRQMREFCDARGIKLQRIRRYDLTENKADSKRFDRPSPCAECNRIRLLADGTLKPCLHSDSEIPLAMDDIEGSLARAVKAKPKHGTVCTDRKIIQIGG